MSSPVLAFPPGLSFLRVIGRVYLFNVVLVGFGAVALGLIDLQLASFTPSLGTLYHLVWLMCVLHCGMLTLVPQIWIARQVWRVQPDLNGIYMAQGSFMGLPRASRWQMFFAAIFSALLLSWVAHQLFLAILSSGWGLARLPQMQSSYLATLSMNVNGMLTSILFEYFWQHVAYQKHRALEAQKLSAHAQLDLLRSQLDPHMLFNTLSNLYELIDEDPKRARAMLLHLIGFLRSTLLGSRSTEQPLSKEFKLLSDYLSIMHIRMGDRLRTQLTLPEDLADTPVPALLLQPLVENAIQHGLEGRKEGGMLTVSASREGDTLLLEVSNTGDGSDRAMRRLGDTAHDEAGESQTHGGFGLRFVQERLHKLYGEQASVAMRHLAQEQLTCVSVRLPITPSDTSPTSPA